MYATTLKCEKNLCCGYVWAMRRFRPVDWLAKIASFEDAYVFNALNNALYVWFMPQKVHIRALLLLGYLQPLQTFLRCNSKLKYECSKKFAHRKPAIIILPRWYYGERGRYTNMLTQWPIPNITRPPTHHIEALYMLYQSVMFIRTKQIFFRKVYFVSSLLVILECVFNWSASSTEVYSTTALRLGSTS